MTTLYDKILHSNFAEFRGKVLFVAGLRARRGFFYLRNLVGVVTHPRHRRKVQPSAIRKILIIRTDRIGDIVLSTPSLRALRRFYPQAVIDYVVQEKYASILNCYEGWNSVFTVDIENRRRLKSVGRQLRERGYDVAIVQHPAAYAYRLAADARSGCTIGWKAKGFGFLLDIGFDDDRPRARRHQVENNLLLCSPLGVADTAPAFPTRETDSGIREFDLFRRRYGINDAEKLLVVHPGSYSPRVRWLPQRFAGLINRAQDAGVRVVLLGADSDRTIIDSVLDTTEKKPITLIGELSLEGLVSFLKHATVFVGNSTGPTHIAASTGIWTFSIFGSRYPMDSLELWRPWGPKGVTVTAPNCRLKDCIPWTCKDMECLRGITVNAVWDQVKAVLERDATPTP